MAHGETFRTPSMEKNMRKVFGIHPRGKNPGVEVIYHGIALVSSPHTYGKGGQSSSVFQILIDC